MRAILHNLPDREIPIDTDIKLQGLKNPLCVIIIGFSSPNMVRALKKLNKDVKYIMVIEPDIEVFNSALKRHYCGDLLEDDNIDFITGIPVPEIPVHIFKGISKMDATGMRPSYCFNPDVLVDPFVYKPVDGKYPEAVESIIEGIKSSAKNLQLSMGCASDTFHRWEQTMRNIDNLANSYSIQGLLDKFADVPTIVVGGGPSVEDFIKNYKPNTALIIACDAVLGRLLKEGITPHIVTRCERKFTTIFSNVDWEKTGDIFYAAYPWTPPEYFSQFKQSFMLFRDNGICRFSNYDHVSVNGGVSSANAALELAFMLGSKKIIMTGIDLCFIDNKSHVSGTEVEFDLEKSKAKWVDVMTNEGVMSTTIPVWQRCLYEYRQGIFKHMHRGAEVINTSLKGARIEGATYKPWSEVNLEKEIKINLKEMVSKPAPEKATELREKLVSLIETLENFLEDIYKLFLFLDDCMITAKREEMRTVNQLRGHVEPLEFFNNTKAVQISLQNLYNEPCRQIDKFRSKYFSQKSFVELMLDTCQIDMFTLENKLNSLKNTIELDHERSKTYIALHVLFFRELEYYAQKAHHLFTEGPDVVTYDPLKETIDLEDRNLDTLEAKYEAVERRFELLWPKKKKESLIVPKGTLIKGVR